MAVMDRLTGRIDAALRLDERESALPEGAVLGGGRCTPARVLTCVRGLLRCRQDLEVASGFEPLSRGFADLRLNHLATPPRPWDYRGSTAADQATGNGSVRARRHS